MRSFKPFLRKFFRLHRWHVVYLSQGPIWVRTDPETGDREYRDMTEDERRDEMWMWAIK